MRLATIREQIRDAYHELQREVRHDLRPVNLSFPQLYIYARRIIRHYLGV